MGNADSGHLWLFCYTIIFLANSSAGNHKPIFYKANYENSFKSTFHNNSILRML